MVGAGSLRAIGTTERIRVDQETPSIIQPNNAANGKWTRMVGPGPAWRGPAWPGLSCYPSTGRFTGPHWSPTGAPLAPHWREMMKDTAMRTVLSRDRVRAPF